MGTILYIILCCLTAVLGTMLCIGTAIFSWYGIKRLVKRVFNVEFKSTIYW